MAFLYNQPVNHTIPMTKIQTCIMHSAMDFEALEMLRA